MDYSVVQFLKERGLVLECVPSSWLLPDGKECFWPTNPYKDITRLIRSNTKPGASWQRWEIKVVLKSVTYKTGRRKCQAIVKKTKLVQSGDEVGARKRKAPVRYSPPGSGDDADELDPPSGDIDMMDDELPSSTSSSPDKVEIVEESALVINKLTVSTPQRSSPYRSCKGNSVTPLKTTKGVTPIGRRLFVESPRKSNETHNSCCAANANLLKQVLKEQKIMANKMDEMLHKLLAMERSRGLQPSDVPEILRRLPLAHIEELQPLETYLSDEDNYNVMVQFLVVAGGDSVPEAIRLVMRRLMADAVAVKMSLTGAKGEKTCFSALKSYNAVLAAVKLIIPAAQQKTITSKLGEFLRQAPRRVKVSLTKEKETSFDAEEIPMAQEQETGTILGSLLFTNL